MTPTWGSGRAAECVCVREAATLQPAACEAWRSGRGPKPAASNADQLSVSVSRVTPAQASAGYRKFYSWTCSRRRAALMFELLTRVSAHVQTVARLCSAAPAEPRPSISLNAGRVNQQNVTVCLPGPKTLGQHFSFAAFTCSSRKTVASVQVCVTASAA